MGLDQALKQIVADVVADTVAKQLEPILAKLSLRTPRSELEGSYDPLFKREPAAVYLGVSPITMACWASDKRGPAFVKLNGVSVRYRKSELDRFAAENQRQLGKRGRPRTVEVRTSGQVGKAVVA